MTRHKKVCSADARKRYREVEYGSPESIRKALEDKNIIDSSFEIPYVSYDIETLSVEEEVDGQKFIVQKPLSIAYFDGSHSETFLGHDIVRRFMNKMKEIQVR